MCRSRRELSNAYFLAKFGFDTAENEPCQVCPTEQPAPEELSGIGRLRGAALLLASRFAEHDGAPVEVFIRASDHPDLTQFFLDLEGLGLSWI